MIPKEAIEAALNEWSRPNDRHEPHEIMEAALTAAFAAMSEPVAWGHPGDFASGYIGDTVTVTLEDREWGEWNFPLYAAPQPAALAAAEERGRIEERERCANIAQAIASGRRSQQVDAIIRGSKREAKDFESMKFCAIEIAEAITKEPTP